MATTLSQNDHERAIDDFDLSYVKEKIVRENSLKAQELPKIEREFKRFLKLVITEKGPLAMIDRRVDELWHSFILFTPQYLEFCEKVMGFFVHHQPRTSVTPVPEGAIKNFIDAYKKKYGMLDAFWLERLSPELKNIIDSGDVPQSLSFDWSGWTGRPD